MSWWRAKYKNDHDEYEITFGSKYREKTKIVEKVCKWIIDKLVQSEDDIAHVRRGEWRIFRDESVLLAECSECGTVQSGIAAAQWDYCPMCGAKMDGDSHG